MDKYRQPGYKNFYKKQAAKCCHLKEKYNSKKELNLIKNGNVKQFFHHVNRKMNSLTPAAPLKNETGLQYDSAKKANIQKNFFSLVFVKNDGILPDFLPRTDSKISHNIEFHLSLVKKVMNKFKAHSAGEPNGLPAILLKNL